MIERTYKRLMEKLRLRSKVRPRGLQGIHKQKQRSGIQRTGSGIQTCCYVYLLSQGLQPQHILLDIGCDSPRTSAQFIRYLNPGNYLGIDEEADSIRLEVEKILGVEVMREKLPEFLVSDSCELEKLNKQPYVALAQSLFTHLSPASIELCLDNLRKVMHPDGVFYAIYHLMTKSRRKVKQIQARDLYSYTQDQMLTFGELNGWSAEHIGEWEYPGHQAMVHYRLQKDRN